MCRPRAATETSINGQPATQDGLNLAFAYRSSAPEEGAVAHRAIFARPVEDLVDTGPLCASGVGAAHEQPVLLRETRWSRFLMKTWEKRCGQGESGRKLRLDELTSNSFLRSAGAAFGETSVSLREGDVSSTP